VLTVTKSLDELIDDTLQEIAQYDERGFRVVLDSAGLPATSTTSCSLVDADRVSPSDVIEFGGELLLVTNVTADAVPVLTVSRGYDGTTAAVHAGSLAGLVNPQFARTRVSRALQTALTRLDAARVFIVTSGTFTRTANKQYVEMPAACRQVLSVGYLSTDTGRFEDDINGWRFFDNLPAAVIASGKIVRLPRYIDNDDSLIITYRTPYRWSTYPNAPVGASTITLPEGAEDLPSLYAVARLCSHREMRRLDLDKSEEWNRSQSVVQGVTSGMVRQMWQEFYKALDEAKTLNQFDIPRPFVPKRRFL
jgi:hypothetical protein